tara:strand:- start:17316 stop:17792 length:477 start_codon:yes stop_codon:yes gene_type:complete
MLYLDSYLPQHIWNNIFILSCIVDEKRHKFLLQIRKAYVKKLITKIYLNYWDPEEYIDWMSNDIIRWLNNDKGTLSLITDKLKKFFKKSFNVTINNDLDLHLWELNYYPTSKQQVNVYIDKMTEKEFMEYYQWIGNQEMNAWFSIPIDLEDSEYNFYN